MGDEYLQEHVTQLLRRGFTGCQFVPRLIKDNRLILNSFDSVDLSAVETFLSAVGEDDCVAMTLFPKIEDERAFLDWLAALDAHESWRITEASDEPYRIHVEWKTEEGKWSSCMGFAPFLEMPLPRRLPCVAIVLWPGPQTRSAGDKVSFHDITTGLDSDTRDKLLKTTNERVGELLELDPELWREVSFGLPQRLREVPS